MPVILSVGNWLPLRVPHQPPLLPEQSCRDQTGIICRGIGRDALFAARDELVGLAELGLAEAKHLVVTMLQAFYWLLGAK